MTAPTAPAVPQSVFSVDNCRPEERFAYWRHSIAAIFDVDAARDVIADFHATIDSHLIGPLLLARTRTRRQRWVRSSRTVSRDGMDHYMIQLYESGGQTVRTDGESRAMQAGQLIVCDLQRTMDNDTTDLQNLSILLPRALLAPQLERPDAVHGLIIDAAAGQGRMLRDHLVDLKQYAGLLSAGDIQELVEVTVDLTAACLNGIARAFQGKAVAPPLLPRIKQYIMANLHDRTLSPESIAERQGIALTKLYEMFEPEGGVLTYIRILRLKAAFDALRDPHQARRPIHDIALEAGYSSEASFRRVFKVMFDVTPGALRRAAEMAKLAPQPGVDRRYEQWLRSLASSSAAPSSSFD